MKRCIKRDFIQTEQNLIYKELFEIKCRASCTKRCIKVYSKSCLLLSFGSNFFVPK